MGLRSRKSGDESRSWKSGDESESAASWKSGDESESAAYGLAIQSFWIGAVEYVIRGFVSVGCDGVGGIVNGGDDKMGEEGHHEQSDEAAMIMVISKSTIGWPVRKKWKIAAEGTLGTPRGTCTRRHFDCWPLGSEGGHALVGAPGGLMLAQ